jgi:hypothetical protein
MIEAGRIASEHFGTTDMLQRLRLRFAKFTSDSRNFGKQLVRIYGLSENHKALPTDLRILSKL